MNIIEMAKEAGAIKRYWGEGKEGFAFQSDEQLEAFAALVRADLMKQVMDTCEAEYKMYDKMIDEDEVGHEEATAMIHLMRKLEKLK
jgi:hypothetical protein